MAGPIGASRAQLASRTLGTGTVGATGTRLPAAASRGTRGAATTALLSCWLGARLAGAVCTAGAVLATAAAGGTLLARHRCLLYLQQKVTDRNTVRGTRAKVTASAGATQPRKGQSSWEHQTCSYLYVVSGAFQNALR